MADLPFNQQLARALMQEQPATFADRFAPAQPQQPMLGQAMGALGPALPGLAPLNNLSDAEREALMRQMLNGQPRGQ